MISKVRIRNFKGLRNYEARFSPKYNVIVGANGAGKSTLLEAIGLAIGGRINGQWPSDALSPYWFHTETTKEFFDAYSAGQCPEVPKIVIEIILDNSSKNPDLARLQGKMNSKNANETGLAFEVVLNDEYAKEFWDYMAAWKENEVGAQLLPTEYFETYWHSFGSPDRLTRKPRGLNFALIGPQTNTLNRGVDRYTRQLLADHIPDEVAANLSVTLRSSFTSSTQSALESVNEKIKNDPAKPLKQLGIQIDPAVSGQWQSGITPAINSLPFSHAGLGEQSIAKVEVSLLKSATKADLILIEEPENHLSHTKLRQLLDRIKALGADQQIIVTTHSSFVLNRLGLDGLMLMDGGVGARLSDLESKDIKFFQKLPNFDTLRLILADHVVLVEGISDLLIVEKAIERNYGMGSSALGIDIISVEGVKHERWFRLAALLDKQVIGIRDNDGRDDGHWEKKYSASLGDSLLFVGKKDYGKTLEPQLYHANKESISALKKQLDIPEDQDFVEWSTAQKADAALQLVDLPDADWKIPDYINEAVRAIFPELL
jgi:predicted ATP-dependent endonuclease of OLD family